MHGRRDDFPAESHGAYERRDVHTGEMSFYFESIPAGFPPYGDEIYEGLPEEACQSPHWGYLLSGQLEFRYTDGEVERITAGQAYYIRPGHRWRCLEAAQTVELSPTEALRANSGCIAKNIRAEETAVPGP